MTVVRIFTPENRLASILHSREAPTGAELVTAAESRVDDLRGVILSYVAAKQKEIAAYAALGDDVLFAECRTLGDTALNVAEVAGAAGLEAVGEIARGISAMIDSLKTCGIWHTAALRLHINALGLIDQVSGADPAAGALVLKRLQAMREAIGIVE